MTRQCPNCGEGDLRDKARFCDNCGFDLTSNLDDGATMALLGAELVEDEGVTRTMLLSPISADEEVTRLIVNSESDQEETLFIPAVEPDDDSGATRAMSDADISGDEGTTRAIFDADISGDEGTTRAMFDAPGPDDGATRAVLAVDSGAIKAADESPAVSVADKGTTPAGAPDTAAFQTQMSLKVGHILRQRYRFEKVLGKGGFGAVYLAEDITLNRRCVVKQMLARGGSRRNIEKHRANFEREARLLAALNDPGHPNIPEIFDYFSDDTGNYLVMKFIEGQNLKDVLGHNEEGKIPWREAVRYATDVCSALNYMHAHEQEPVMHRDIKPANILLGNDGRVWLVDFGLAIADVSEEDVIQGSGTLGYTPLEQWFGEPVVASDIYAVGATLHHLVTGIDPMAAFAGQFNIDLIQKSHGQFEPIRTVDPQLPKDLETIIGQAVAADPAARPTALQLLQQLEVLNSEAQKVALYTFKNGKSAKTTPELVDLCEQNRQEAEAYLYNGDFERWFLLINRNDLAEAATQAVKQGQNQKKGLEKFLKLILPNLYLRRLRKAGWQLTRLTVQSAVIAVVVIFLLVVLGSFGLRWFLQQSLGSLDWNFYSLNLDRENHYSQSFINQKFNAAAGVYFDNNIQVDLHPPDRLNLTAAWNGIPLEAPVILRLEEQKPHFYLSEISGIPLYLIGDNLSQGINAGVDEAFRKGPVDLSRLDVREEAIVFKVELSRRAPFATPTPTVTPTPTPTFTPTPVDITLVVIFNELDQNITLEIKNESWNQTLKVAANDSRVLETPPGTYNYMVRVEGREEIVAQGERTWTLNKAYRLGIGLLEDRQ